MNSVLIVFVKKSQIIASDKSLYKNSLLYVIDNGSIAVVAYRSMYNVYGENAN